MKSRTMPAGDRSHFTIIASERLADSTLYIYDGRCTRPTMTCLHVRSSRPIQGVDLSYIERSRGRPHSHSGVVDYKEYDH